MRHLTVYAPELHPTKLLTDAHAYPSHLKLADFIRMTTPDARKRWRLIERPIDELLLLRVHHAAYLERERATRPLHYEQSRWACAAMVEAVLLALGGGTFLSHGAGISAFSSMSNMSLNIVCAPVSGFHHAGSDFGGGFCHLNGLVLAALLAVDDGTAPVLVLDGDAHHGNGTADILERDPTAAGVVHVTRGCVPDDQLAAVWQRHIAAIESGYYKLVLYQAAADAWEGDPLGSGYLTKDELAERDRAVFDACVRSKTPCVWCFGGGYAGRVSTIIHMETHLQADLALADHTLSAIFRQSAERAAAQER